jgi:hypothetical protein
MTEAHLNPPPVDVVGEFLAVCGVDKASPVFATFKKDGELEHWCSLLEPRATMQDESMQISAFVLDAPVNTLCRARIRSQRMGAAGKAPCVCYANGFRSGNEPNQVHLHSVSVGGLQVVREFGVDVSVYTPGKAAPKGLLCVFPMDLGLVSPDRILELEFQAMGREAQHLLLAVSYKVRVNKQPCRF